MSTTFTHVGITVDHHEVSKCFYMDALGFTPNVSIDASEETFPGLPGLLEVEGADVLAEFLTNGPQTIELVSYHAPGTLGSTDERRPMNGLGLTHLCFLVEDVNDIAGRVEQYGGAILAHTRKQHDQPDGVDRDYLFCTDPNGVRIELIAAPKLPNTRDEPQLTRR